jgi:protein-disulfide isomerase
MRLTARITLALCAAATAACGSSGDGRANAAAAPASGAAPGTAQASGAPSGAAADTALVRAADAGRIAGAATAKVWMIVASDFQCPYCKMWHDQTYEALKREYVDAGKIRVAFLNFPLEQHEQALPAAEAAMCASAQGKFWEYHTALFNGISAWGKPGDQSAQYDALAKSLGLDVANFTSCTRSHVMRPLIEADRDRMLQRGVQSTPSFFVGSQKVEGAQPLEAFRQVIDAAIAQAR